MIRFIVKLFKILFILAIWAAAGAGAAYYFGSQPDVTYYPDGKTKSSVSRKWFIPNGLASYYRPDGTLSQQCTFVDGKQTGEATIYFAGKPVKTRYQDGQLTGSADLGNIAFLKDKPLPSVTFLPNRGLELVFAQDDMRLQLKANRVCADDSLIARLQAYADTLDKQQLKLVLECLKLQHLSWDQNQTSCHMQGEYLYPALASDISVSCDVPYDNQELLTGIEILSVQGSYVLDQDKLSFDIFDPHKSTSKFFVSYRGIAPIVKSISETLINENADDYVPNILTAILQNLTSSDAYVMLNNQKIWDISGDFNLMNGFSDPYYISSYTDNAMSSQFKISSDGLNFKALYPISKTPMLAMGLNVNETFKLKYQNMMQDISKALAEQIGTDDQQQTLTNLTNYAWEFSDLFKSVYASVMDIQGQPALKAQIKLKSGISSDDISESPALAFDLMFITYQNGDPTHQVIGSFDKGFQIDGRTAQLEEVLSVLNNTSLNAVLADINNELELKYGYIIDNAQTPEDYIGIDPFFLGFYRAYKDTILKYQTNQTLTQIMTLVYGLQSIYAEDKNYNNLSAADLKKAGIITPDMLNDNNVLLNAFGGKIRILKSMAQADSEAHDAFILIYEGLPSDACFELATIDWASLNSGFIGIKASARGSADVTKAFLNKSFEKRPSGTVYKPFDAQRACSNSNSGSVALKFQ